LYHFFQEIKRNKKREKSTSFSLNNLAWQIHTLPGRFQPSTISVYGLNF